MMNSIGIEHFDSNGSSFDTSIRRDSNGSVFVRAHAPSGGVVNTP